MPDADSAERGSAVTAAEAAGETAPRRDREGRNRPFCSTWTLNAVAAAMHAAWFVIFVLLWALDENEDGSKRDVTYPLFYTSARFGKPPDPPTTPAESLVLDASVSTELGSTPINPFPSCDAPRDARVGTMPVSPAFRDSHLVMSLHWLVSSFFALSFLFQAAAAVADARRVGFWKKNSGKNDDDVSASFLAGGASEERRAKSADDHVTTTHRAAMASWLRFIEYSFSAAVMVVAIALQVGLMDAWMLFALAALTWTTMMLGLVGERVLAAEERVVAAGARAERSSRLDRDRDDESETKARLDAIAATAEPPRSEGDAAAPKRAGDAWKSPDYDPATLRASRRCPACVDGRLGLKLSKNGGFIGCSNYNTDTKCAYARPISTTNGDDAESMRTDPWLSDGEIGVDPETSRTVSVRRGPYGPYVQLDPTANEGTPRTFGLQNVPEVTADKLTLNVALALLKYPMTLGVHPTEGGDVTMKIGPYGWYVNHGDVNAHIPAKTLKRVRDDARAAAMIDEPYEDKIDDFAFEHADADEEEEEEGEMDAEELESAKLDGLGLERASPTKTTTSEERDAVFLARFAPIPLDVAVELITERKNNPRTGRGFRGRAKKDKEVASASATKGKTSKTKAAATPKPKPEPKPKRTRAPSAFFLYSAEKRPTLEPGLRAPEQAKILGAGWKALGDDERSRYEREARDAKAAMPADDAAAAKREKKKSTRTPSAYVLFCAEERANLPPGLSGPGQMKLLGAKWKEIDAVSRARFEVAAADAKDAAAAAAA